MSFAESRQRSAKLTVIRSKGDQALFRLSTNMMNRRTSERRAKPAA